MDTNIVKRLSSLSSLGKIPRRELVWLMEHSHLQIYEVGTVIGKKGTVIENLWIMLTGRIITRVDRGAGPKIVNELIQGDVTGLLPYSRLTVLPGEVRVEEKAEALSIHKKHFPGMINKCPKFTALTVHSMIDRTRVHNASDLQDEKMMSMGRLAAGLAHELNNPAAAAKRNAKLLGDIQISAESALQSLTTSGITSKQLSDIREMRNNCLKNCEAISLSPLQKSDLQDAIYNWLIKNKVEPVLSGQLADTAVTCNDLDKLSDIVPDNTLEIALKWIVASCSAYTLAVEIEHAAEQIFKIVETVKKFTYMDNLTEKETVNVESGLRDTVRILDSKITSKSAKVKVNISEDLPQVSANGAELNQVWFNLLDNALDAISNSGTIRIDAHRESNRVVVCILDDGSGIPNDMLDRIFDPFYTTKPPGKGTGLGLDITRRLVRRYNGDISVRSRPGHTEFRISLVYNLKDKMKRSGNKVMEKVY